MQFGSHSPNCEWCVKVKKTWECNNSRCCQGGRGHLRRQLACLGGGGGWERTMVTSPRAWLLPVTPTKMVTVIYGKPQPSAFFPLWHVFCRWPSAVKHSKMEKTFMKREEIVQALAEWVYVFFNNQIHSVHLGVGQVPECGFGNIS